MKQPQKYRAWSNREVEILRAEWPTAPSVQSLAQRLNRSVGSIYHKACRLGLRKQIFPAPANKTRLSPQDLLWFKLNYPHMRTELIALRLGVSARTCNRLALRLGLRKTAQFMKELLAFATMKAAESHRKNGTYPPKGQNPR